MGGLIVEVVDEGLAVGDITVTELRVKVVDCRSNENITKARTSRVKIICGGLTIDKKFDLEKDKAAISETGVEGSMIALQRLGYETATTATTKAKLPKAYDATWRGYYNNYWKARVPDFQDLEAGNPTPDMMNHIINEYNSHRATDDDGFLRVKIPVPMLAANTLSVEIGFFNFPVVQEATLPRLTLPFRRSDDANVETQFNIKWNGTQNITWNNDTHWGKAMGWEVWQSRTLRGELKVSETLDIGVFSALKVFNTISFSRFYIHDNNTTPHFVLLGMQWCQPVWDGVDDPTVERHPYPRSNNDSFINRKYDDGTWIKGLNMHIVTQHSAGDANPFGHYYGFFDNLHPFHRIGTKDGKSVPRRHTGIDYYSGPNSNDPIFAIYGGLVKYGGSDNHSYGNNATLKLNYTPTSDFPCFFYAHLRETKSNSYGMSGKIIGYGSRTGFLGAGNNAMPSHMHLELRKVSGNIIELSKISDATELDNFNNHPIGNNAKLFQGNKYPLMLPCKCKYGAMQAVQSCKFNKKDILLKCWAVQEFPYDSDVMSYASNNNTDQEPASMIPTENIRSIKFICPHIFTNSDGLTAAEKKIKLMAQLQAKLKFIYANQGRVSIPTSQYFSDLRTTQSLNPSGKTTDLTSYRTKISEGGIGAGTNTAVTVKTKEAIKGIICYVNSTEPSTVTDKQVADFINFYVNEIKTDDPLVIISVTWLNTICVIANIL